MPPLAALCAVGLIIVTLPDNAWLHGSVVVRGRFAVPMPLG